MLQKDALKISDVGLNGVSQGELRIALQRVASEICNEWEHRF